ncbi:hypothetical protein JKP88DRAFT_237576 [Tribonema minus]|uniref:Uncharacterized protein n=1 Tax=Tribonema minus TaxID=303371 RepID=A0A836CI70_9STRA|nr:hypothetical protein JKP88DRAFT_237576 [Tribonema minus]
MLPEDLTSELQELPTAHELMEMARQMLAEGYAQLRLVCMQGESPTGDSVSCLSTMASIVASAEAGGADAVVSALCPTTTDNALIDSGCCMRDIMAAVPRSELPEADFWVKVDQGCGLGLSTSDPDRALDFCANPFATSTAESFVVKFRVAGAESWCAAEQVTRVQQAATTVLGAKDSQVVVSSCRYSPETLDTELGLSITAIGMAQVDTFDDMQSAATNAAFLEAIADALALPHDAVTGDATVALVLRSARAWPRN